MDVVFSNTTEAFLDILNASSKQVGGLERIHREASLSQRALFWLGDNKIVVTQTPIPSALIQQCKNITGWSTIDNWVPDSERLDLCTAMLDNGKLFRQLVALLKLRPKSRISAYAPTKNFATLIQNLRAAGCDFRTVENVSAEGLWIQAYLDSKAGFRLEATRLQALLRNVFVPDGFVCSDEMAAEHAMAWFLSRSKGCVVKSDRGESGWGTLIFDQHDSISSAISKFRQQKEVDAIWSYTPIIVEERIHTSEDALISPSVELFVSDDEVRISYSCAQVIKKSEFRGVFLGPSSMLASVRQEVEAVGKIFGERYRELGYRGYFDVDFVVRSDGKSFVLETNMRRTGGTHVFDLSCCLGLSAESHHYCSEDSVPLRATVSAANVLNHFGPVLFERQNRTCGMIPTIVDPVSNTLGYIAVGRDEANILELQRNIRSLIDTYGG